MLLKSCMAAFVLLLPPSFLGVPVAGGVELCAELCDCCAGRAVYFTLSHKLSGRLGLLEREAAAILNASLQPLAAAVIPGCSRALQRLGLQHVPLFLTGNDGTLMSASAAQEYPVLTFKRWMDIAGLA